MTKQKELEFEERIAELERKIAILELAQIVRPEPVPFITAAVANNFPEPLWIYMGCDSKPRSSGQI